MSEYHRSTPLPEQRCWFSTALHHYYNYNLYYRHHHHQFYYRWNHCVVMISPAVSNVVLLVNTKGLQCKVHTRLIILTVLLSWALCTKWESNRSKILQLVLLAIRLMDFCDKFHLDVHSDCCHFVWCCIAVREKKYRLFSQFGTPMITATNKTLISSINTLVYRCCLCQ